MLENVLLGPAGEVEEGARRQKGEALGGELAPPLARQHLVEPGAERVEMDLKYIRNRSLWMDLKLLGLTPIRVIRGRGAY